MMKERRLSRTDLQELEWLSTIWILACIDKNHILTFEGIKERLGLPKDAAVSDMPVIEWGLSHLDRIRQGRIAYRDATAKSWQMWLIFGVGLANVAVSLLNVAVSLWK